ncbi:MAG: hypothetical protein WCQ67_10395 [Treponema sp.]
MKKFIMILAMTAVVFAGVFAQDADSKDKELRAELAGAGQQDNSVQTIQIEDKYASLHPSATNVTIELRYTPLTGEVRLYYTCMAASYQQGEAMNTAMAVYEQFAQDNQYYHYTYKAKDKTKYFKDGRDIKMATYTSYVVFTR